MDSNNINNITKDNIEVGEVSVLDISIYDMSKEELQKEFSNLRELYIKAQNELETKSQIIYNQQRDIARARALENDYQQELELLQGNEKNVTDKFKKQIYALEEHLSATRALNLGQIQFLEQEIISKDKEIVELQEKLKLKEEINLGTENSEGFLTAENARYQEENRALLEISHEMKETVDKLRKENSELVINLQNVSSDLKSMTENYKLKKEEVAEMQILMESLQGEAALLRTELENVKSKPLDPNVRGNSLFAEVNDRRVELQKNMKTMKSQYLELRNQHSKMVEQISQLQMENETLTRKWKEDLLEKSEDNQRLLNNHRQRIEVLEKTNQEIRNLLDDRMELKHAKYEEDLLQFMTILHRSRENQSVKIIDDLNKESLLRSLLMKELHESNENARDWKSKCHELECKIGQLKSQIENLKLMNPAKEQENETCSTKPKAATIPNVVLNMMKKLNSEECKPSPPAPIRKQIVEMDLNRLLINSQKKPVTGSSDQKENAEVTTCSIMKSESKEKIKSVVMNKNDPKEKTKSVKFQDNQPLENDDNKPRRRGQILTCPVVYVRNERN